MSKSVKFMPNWVQNCQIDENEQFNFRSDPNYHDIPVHSLSDPDILKYFVQEPLFFNPEERDSFLKNYA